MPQAIGAAIAAYVGPAAASAYAGTITVISYATAAALTLAYSDYARKRANAKARSAANENAKDREVMIRSAIAPRRIIYGRDKVSGPIVFMQSTGDKSQFLHLVVALAAHECDAVEKIYFNEVELPELDEDGFVTEGVFKSPDVLDYTSHTGTTNGSGVLTLPQDAIEIQAAYETATAGFVDQTHYPLRVHVEGSDEVSNLPADTEVTVGYTYMRPGEARVRVHVHLGGSGQTADADLISECGGTWTEDHIGTGICYLAVRLEYDQDIFGALGVPNISALVRGKKVYDPRTDETVWSNNAALCVADFIKSDEGMRATDEQVPDAEVITAANICDEDIDLVLGGAETQKRYTCDNSFTTERSPRDVLGELAVCMAGRAVWTQGRWLVRAGAHRTPTLTITDDMVVGKVSIIPRASRSDLFNAVRATHRDDTADFAEVQAPLVTNSSYETSDGGVRIVRQIDIPTLADTYRAQRLAKIDLERARQALTVQLSTTLAAYDLAPSDTVMLTLSLYGFDEKVFEVIDRTIGPDGLLHYTLRETAAGVWDWNYGEATVGDLAPNTTLPSPFALPSALANLAIDQYSTSLADGTVFTQAQLSWDPVEDAFVLDGGRIEVQWSLADPISIVAITVPGDADRTTLAPIMLAQPYIARARAVNASNRAGPWVYVNFIGTADSGPPEDVANFTSAIKPGQVVLTWDPCEAPDYEVTVIRVGGMDWDSAVFGWEGKASERNVARPPNGTYTLWAKHRDRSGNYSANAVSLTVTVDDSIDLGAGGTLILTVDAAPVFFFTDGTTHSGGTPASLTFTARLIGLFGEADFEAEAFDAITAGSSLGAVTLTGTGNARTLTPANFVAPGTSGSVRRVDVTGTASGASDVISVIRYDPTVSDPFIYLSNPQHSVGTDEAGDFGDYSGAFTAVAVFDAGAEDTDNWSFAITPDSGVTATINGGAGPVTGTTSVTVAVSAMTIDDGAVLITASKSGESDLTATFRVVKRPAQGVPRLLYFSPRTDIVLPTDTAGNVTSYTNAWTKAYVSLQNGVDATADYTFSAVGDGVVVEVTGNTIRITDWVDLGTFGSSAGGTHSLTGTGWDSVSAREVYGDGVWLQLGKHSTFGVTWSVVKRSEDRLTYTNVTLPASEAWTLGAWTDGAFVLAEGGVGASTATCYSTDGGNSWTASALPASGQWQDLQAGYGTFLIWPQSTTTGYRSTNGGASWSSVTTPSNPGRVRCIGINRWLHLSSLGTYQLSTDNGSTWTSVTIGGTVYSALGYKGIAVCAFLGTSQTQLAVSANGGSTWQLVNVPITYADGTLLNIQNVLWLHSRIGGYTAYSTDGIHWTQGGTIGTSTVYLIASEELDISVYPLLDATSAIYSTFPMTATSATEASVTVTASKAGEDDLTAVLPVQKGTIVPPQVTSNINPAFLQLPATNDGVVTDYSNASFTVTAVLAALTITDEYTWAWTTSHLTPSSGTGSTATITAMDDAEDTGAVYFTGTRAGYDTITLSAQVVKLKGTDDSGIIIGARYTAPSVTNTFVGFKLTSTGLVQMKEGTGGTWVTLGQWNNPVGASAGAGAWVRFDLLEAVDGTSTFTATTGTFLALTSDREVSLEDTSSGLHQAQVVVYLSPNSGGTLPRASLVTLMLDVP